MLTRCPSCATIFRVSTEQLKARQGKVRCGSCQSVFNALDSLIEEVVPVSEPIAVSPAPTWGLAPEALAHPSVDDAATGAQLDEVINIGEPVGTDLSVDITDIKATVPAGKSAVIFPEPIQPSAPPLPPAPPVSAAVTATPVPVSVSDPEPESTELPTRTPIEIHEAESDSLAEDTPAQARFGRLWALGIVLAIVAMLTQALMMFRVEIATSVPETRPWFVAACELLDCHVDLARQAHLLSIESSDLNPDPAFPGQSGRLRLHASLHNRASHAQEWPLLEVTLTDTSDRPLIRRALTAKEYLLAAKPPQSNLEQGIGGQQEISIELALDSGDVLASGYRLYLFYP